MRKRLVTRQLVPWLLGLLGGCAAQNVATPAKPSLRDLSLTQAYGSSTVQRVADPAPTLVTTLVFDPQNDEDLVAVLRTYGQWCEEHGGTNVDDSSAQSCPEDPLSGPGCLTEASIWYARQDPGLGFRITSCVDARGRPLAALLRQSHEGKQDGLVAVLEGDALHGFAERYQRMAQATAQSWEDAKRQQEADKAAALDKAIAELDSVADPALKSTPSARMSIDFIREKVASSAYRASVRFVTPCTLEARSSDTNLTEVDLRKIELNVLDQFAERTIDNHGRVFNTYRLSLKVGPRTAYLDYTDADAAQRSARAFNALAKRCGNKPDTRFN